LRQVIVGTHHRGVPTRLSLVLVLASVLALLGCDATTAPSASGPTATAVVPAEADTFLCRLVATTGVEHDRLVHALALWDGGDHAAAAADARVAFTNVSAAMSNRPPLPMPTPGDAVLVLMLAWPDVALAEMTVASALAPDVRPLSIPVVEAHVALADLDRAVAAARSSSRHQAPNGSVCSAPG
jgi:hypothetical protein